MKLKKYSSFFTMAVFVLPLLQATAFGADEEKMVAPPATQQPAPESAPGVGPGSASGSTPGAPSVIIVEPPVISQPVPSVDVPPVLPKLEQRMPEAIVPVLPVQPAQIKPVVPVEPPKVEPPKPEKKPEPEKKMEALSPAQFLPQSEIADPAKIEKKPASAPKKSELPKEKPVTPKKVGEELRIPKDAAKSGKKDFLEGCWRGKADGKYGDGKQAAGGMSFCFDKNGQGRREWVDDRRGEVCHGEATGSVDSDGVLHIISGDAKCPSGEVWKTKEIICRDNGRAMQCRYLRGSMSVGPFVRK